MKQRATDYLYKLFILHHPSNSHTEENQNSSSFNFCLILLGQFFNQIGDSLANAKVVLPWVFAAVSAPLFMVGLLVPLRESGSLLPQIFLATLIERFALRKRLMVTGSVLQAMSIFSMAIVVWFFDGALAGYLLLLSLLVFSLARALSSIASKDVIGKTIPQGQRGQLSGWATSAAGIVTLLSGIFFLLMKGQLQLYHYVVLLGVGALMWIFSSLSFGCINEPASDYSSDDEAYTWKKYIQMLRQDRSLQKFLITRTLLLASALMPPYVVVLAQQEVGDNASLLGMFIVSGALAAMLAGPLLGKFADYSSRQLMVWSVGLVSLAGIVVGMLSQFTSDWFAHDWLLPVMYFLMMVAHAGVRIGRKTYILDLGEGDQRVRYVAISNSIMGIMLLIVGGISSALSFLPITMLILLFSLMGILAMLAAYWLPEI